nr:immunoglobulin heavy chain junction region [Macaca mulatta]MOW46624.1 immunoglobulin heavy chain junction region [Macaca mulatta]MOW47195.1 immunoglobulin heavy chain junction region [Macaca mulatta]MOW47286.1 immunoglobulin heavy chain junction region [Macaca mulatta]MOW48214.1 immunoglobulin heavy chain junction region [Macaca mulatta]
CAKYGLTATTVRDGFDSW